MSRHIIYIINPVSGTTTKKKLQQLIEEKTGAKKIPFQVFPSVASGDYTFLQTLITEQKITDIVIAGGDGTVSQVVGSLLHLNVNFGIIPCGSGNGLAYTAKIPGQTTKALDIIFRNKSSAIDGFYINDRFSCMLCGLGFDANVAYDFAQQSKRGLTTYIKQVIKNFFSARTYSFELRLKEKTFTTDAYFISIANSNQFGNNFTIAPQASLSDGLLDIVVVTRQNKLRLLIETFNHIRGKNKLQPVIAAISKKAVIYFQTDALRIINHSGAPLHIDGDPAESHRELKIEIQKKCFRLIQP